jgi:polyisoprenoid-binding protein YceI
MTESSISRPPVTVPAPPGRYTIDPERSTVTFTTRHLFGLAPVRGTLALRDGQVEVAGTPGDSAVQARVAVSTFRTGNDARDAAVLSARLLDAEAHPSLTFTSTGLSGLPGEPAEPRDGSHWVLYGELAVRGVSRPVEAQASVLTLDEGGSVLRASARLRVDRYAFGVTGYRGLAARWLTVDIDLCAERKAQS